MPKKKSLQKIIRVQLLVNEENYKLLEEASKIRNGNLGATAIKAISILQGIIKEEVFLTTPNGEKIPRSIILS